MPGNSRAKSIQLQRELSDELADVLQRISDAHAEREEELENENEVLRQANAALRALVKEIEPEPSHFGTDLAARIEQAQR